MYQAATALLTKIGLESKDHATTAAVLEYFFSQQIDKGLMEIFNRLKERKDKLEVIAIEEKYIDYFWKTKRARETLQYGVSITCKETNTIMQHAREFVNKIKLTIGELNEEFTEVISIRIRELREGES